MSMQCSCTISPHSSNLSLMARQASRCAKFVMPFGAFGFRTKDGQRICPLWGAFENEIKSMNEAKT